MKKDDKSYSETVDMVGYRESCKLFFDFFKHLTTLSTGSLVLITTYLAKLANEGGIDSITGVVGWLLVSIGASVFAMFVFAGHVYGKKEQQIVNRNLIVFASLIAGGSFIIGLWRLSELVQVVV